MTDLANLCIGFSFMIVGVIFLAKALGIWFVNILAIFYIYMGSISVIFGVISILVGVTKLWIEIIGQDF